jgi:hypothetical protein
LHLKLLDRGDLLLQPLDLGHSRFELGPGTIPLYVSAGLIEQFEDVVVRGDPLLSIQALWIRVIDFHGGAQGLHESGAVLLIAEHSRDQSPGLERRLLALRSGIAIIGGDRQVQ